MYDQISSNYDRFVNWQNRLAGEMPFIERLLQEAGARSVLDTGCGTGMHAIALARRGYLAAGADISQGMIERARQNTAAAGVEIQFQNKGFGELRQAFRADFDAILCLGNSLPHLLTRQDLANALADFADCLRPGGLLLVQNRNFDYILDQHERWMEPQVYQEGGQQWTFLRFYDFQPDGLLAFNMVILYQETAGAGKITQQVETSYLRPMRQAELGQALSDQGFESIHSYGNLAGAPFDKKSSSNLVVAAVITNKRQS